jgi:hypothetical protein
MKKRFVVEIDSTELKAIGRMLEYDHGFPHGSIKRGAYIIKQILLSESKHVLIEGGTIHVKEIKEDPWLKKK